MAQFQISGKEPSFGFHLIHSNFKTVGIFPYVTVSQYPLLWIMYSITKQNVSGTDGANVHNVPLTPPAKFKRS